MTASRRGRDSGLVRPFVIAGGRPIPSRNHFDHHTLVISRPGTPRSHLTAEHRRVVELCLPGALSVAEIGSHLDLPVSVLCFPLADLMDTGHITTRAPIPTAQLPDEDLLRAVLDGLRRRF